MDETILEAAEISAVILCFNEQKTITSTLDSLHGLVDEIIIVDTGSTDNTVRLILQHPARVKLYFRDWNNDFSAMRNFAISLTSNAWCLVIDADECIATETRHVFRNTLRKISHDDINALYAPLIDNLDGSSLINNARIFRKRTSLRYHGKVHEYLEAEDYKLICLPDIKILHYGYINSAYEEKNKHLRNKSLLAEQMRTEPDNLRWKYFALRYLTPCEPEYEAILQHFGALPLPYADSWEVYAFNVKSKLIMYLLEKHEYKHARQHAKALYKHYRDKNTCLLYLLANYLQARTNFLMATRTSLGLLGETENLPTDEYLSEKLNPDGYKHILAEMAMYIQRHESENGAVKS
ncbi:glycosyltransferase family 2 protein [Cedecea colo]|uniref:Glycosyltransferase family 2 protein n=1 Tax=Cedecea colo TaxID=2552946 RepID=A0ABX0VGF7_9ENTR|nr:glycosyltransferase family 2 protein [Cedecea colo]NIY46163.1 glycosyltransferase family 2 protein [Cedecea colo]